MDALEIDEDVPESATRATNRWLTKNLNDATTAVAPKRRRRSKRNTCKKRCGPASKKSSTLAPRSCASRESPAGACRLARTERHTAKTPIDRFSGVCRRCRSFGARTGTPGDGHGRGRYREGFCRTSRVAGRVESVEGCKKCSRLHRDQVLCNFLCNFNAIATKNTVKKGPDTERARAVWTPF